MVAFLKILFNSNIFFLVFNYVIKIKSLQHFKTIGNLLLSLIEHYLQFYINT